MKVNSCIKEYEVSSGSPARGSLIRRLKPVAQPKPVEQSKSLDQWMDKGIDLAVTEVARSVFQAAAHVFSLAPYYPKLESSETYIY